MNVNCLRPTICDTWLSPQAGLTPSQIEARKASEKSSWRLRCFAAIRPHVEGQLPDAVGPIIRQNSIGIRSQRDLVSLRARGFGDHRAFHAERRNAGTYLS